MYVLINQTTDGSGKLRKLIWISSLQNDGYFVYNRIKDKPSGITNSTIKKRYHLAAFFLAPNLMQLYHYRKTEL